MAQITAIDRAERQSDHLVSRDEPTKKLRTYTPQKSGFLDGSSA